MRHPIYSWVSLDWLKAVWHGTIWNRQRHC